MARDLQESNLYFPQSSGSAAARSVSLATLQNVTAMGRETWLDAWNILLHFACQYTVNIFSGHFIILRLSSKTQFTGNLPSENWDE